MPLPPSARFITCFLKTKRVGSPPLTAKNLLLGDKIGQNSIDETNSFFWILHFFDHPKIDRTLYARIHKYQSTVVYLTCFINRSTQNMNSSSTTLVKQKQTTSCVTNVVNNLSISMPLLDTFAPIFVRPMQALVEV